MGRVTEKRIQKKKGEIMRGLAIEIAQKKVYIEKTMINKEVSSDVKNRVYVREKIIQNIKNGMSKDEALDEIMKDPIVKEFEYLKNNGLDIRKCFENWTAKEIGKIGKDNSANISIKEKEEER